MENYSKSRPILVQERSIAARDWLFAVVGPIWSIIAWFAAAAFIAPLLYASLDGLGFAPDPSSQVARLLSGFLYAPVTLLLMWIGFRIYSYYRPLDIRAVFGLKTRPTIKSFGWSFLTYGLYFLSIFLLTIAMSFVLPLDTLTQKQDLDLALPQSTSDYIVLFVMLVLLAPFFEELLFRGALFGSMRRSGTVIIPALVTSILFGLAHGQLNVSLDTFVLSLFLCFLRVKTDSIWPCMLLHALKNCLAFVVLFVVPIGR